MKVVLVGVFGAAGALSRYGIGAAVGTRTFPWATLGINIVGSLLLGVIVAVGLEHRWDEDVVLPLTVGFLGAFTTFSTFSYETYTLLRTDRVGAALLYLGLSVGVGLLAAAVGYTVGRNVL